MRPYSEVLGLVADVGDQLSADRLAADSGDFARKDTSEKHRTPDNLDQVGRVVVSLAAAGFPSWVGLQA
jgi:hypothetical protein